MIEMLVVLLIIAILAAIAYPSYQTAILKTKRSEGQAALMKGMQQQERYYALHMTYITFSADSTDVNARKFAWFSGDNAASSSYEISAQACSGEEIRDCVQLIARPGTARVNSAYRDARCGNLTLTSTGRKSANAKSCW